MNKQNKSIDIGIIAMCAFGIIFFVIGYFMLNSSNAYKSNSVVVTGIITEIDTEHEWRYRNGDTNTEKAYDVFVSYEFEEIRYNTKIDSYSSSMYKGAEIKLYIDKDNPEIARASETEDFIGYAFVLFGAFFILWAIKLVRRENPYAQGCTPTDNGCEKTHS